MSRMSMLAGLSLLLSPLAPPAPAPTAEHSADAVVASLFRWNAPAEGLVDSPYCWNCWSRANLGYYTHQFDWSAVFYGYECDGDGCHFYERPGLCEWYHSSCMVIGSEWLAEPAGLDRVERVVAQGDPASLRDLLNSSRALALNPDRQAVQVLNCSGEVIAHFPISTGLAARLTE